MTEKSDPSPAQRFLITAAWVIMLLVSILPNILWYELVSHSIPAWLIWVKLGLLVLLALVCLFWKSLRPLRPFIFILIFLFVIEEAVGQFVKFPFWQKLFGSGNAPFTQNMLGIQLSRLIISVLMIGALSLLGYSRRQFFLTRGDLKAPITPVRWLGFPKPDPWTRFGGQFAIYISLGTLIFLILGGRPTAAQISGLLPLLPMVLLFAIMNAFNEEMTYRSSLLAGLENVVGARQAVWIAAAFFGIGHYFGVPYGIVGILMATFLGWILGKAMVETRGFFWAWFIHFLQDVMIFSFMAIGSITPGG